MTMKAATKIHAARGFTLAEMAMVVTVVGLVAAGATTSLTKMTTKQKGHATMASIVSDFKQYSKEYRAKGYWMLVTVPAPNKLTFEAIDGSDANVSENPCVADNGTVVGSATKTYAGVTLTIEGNMVSDSACFSTKGAPLDPDSSNAATALELIATLSDGTEHSIGIAATGSISNSLDPTGDIPGLAGANAKPPRSATASTDVSIYYTVRLQTGQMVATGVAQNEVCPYADCSNETDLLSKF